MGSYEFELHMALDEEEATGPDQLPRMWAHLMAAIANGPLTKRSGDKWQATDFMGPSWVPPPPPPTAPTAASLKAFAQRAMGERKK
ncbi:MAG: hypothetical protein ABI605_10870 [Rhizobacter sp.]